MRLITNTKKLIVWLLRHIVSGRRIPTLATVLEAELLTNKPIDGLLGAWSMV